MDPRSGGSKGGGSKGGSPKGGAPKGSGSKGGARRVGGPKFRAFFPLSRHHCHSFLPSLGGLIVEFWWCFEAPEPLKSARLEFLGCRVKPRRPQSRRGFTRQPESPNVYI